MAAVRPHDDLVARVVAWHNRHPLARRITPAQVGSVGLVSFPFHAPAVEAPPPTAVQPLPEAPGRLRDRARAQAGQAGRGAQGGTEGRGAAAPSAAAGADAPDGPSARARKGWRAAFTENLLDPHTTREVARWLLRHGSRARPRPADAPVREVEVAAGHAPAGKALVRLWVHTAAVELGAQRVRVLVSPLGARRVLGPRILATGGRIAAWSCAVAAAAMAGAAVSLLGPSGWPAGGALPAGAVATPAALATPVAAPPAPAVAAVTPTFGPGAVPAAGHASTHAASQAGSARTVPTSSGTAPAAASSASAATPHHATAPPTAFAASAATPPAQTPAASPVAALPLRPDRVPHAAPTAASANDGARMDEGQTGGRLPVAPTGSRPSPWARPLAPALSDEARREAREASEAARAERARLAAARAMAASPPGAFTPASAPSDALAGAPAPVAVRPAAAAPPATAWAVSTRPLRTRFESEQMLAALRDVAYRSGYGNELRLEVMPSGDDWRAIGWPLATRAEAERLRATLIERGLKAEVVQF